MHPGNQAYGVRKRDGACLKSKQDKDGMPLGHVPGTQDIESAPMSYKLDIAEST